MRISASADIVGEWLGIFTVAQRCTFITIHFELCESELTATLARPFDGMPIQELTQIIVDSPHTHFVLSSGAELLQFSGIWNGLTLSGHIQHNDAEGVFHLIRQVDIPSACYSAYTGAYQLAPDHIISISNNPSLLGRDQLAYTDFLTGEYRRLFPLSPTIFVAGPSILCPVPTMLQAIFQAADDTGDPELTVHLFEQTAQLASKIALQHEDVRFSSSEHTLAGVLTLPAHPGPHPAVVIIGYEPRDVYLELAHLFASAGIATLRYDRRGSGASSGDWRQMTFEMQADDAVASVHFLQRHAAIDPAQVGLWGLSQTGWIAPLAASRSRDIAFVIPVSGPGVSVEQQELYRIGQWIRTDGYPEQDILEAIAYMTRLYDVLRNGSGWDLLAPSIQQARQSVWASYVILPSSFEEMQHDTHWQWIRRILGYDPVPALTQVSCPVLAIFGGLDSVVPAEQSAAIWEQALCRGGNTDYTIKVFPNGNHGIWAATTGGMNEWSCLKGHVPDYYQTMIEWVRQRVTIAAERN
jgi:uncharacterized protein